MKRSWILVPLVPALLVACEDRGVAARADSAQVALTRQLALSRQLAAQKDSLTSVVLEADDFIAAIDSQIARVKGLPAAKRRDGQDPLQAQLTARKQMLARVEALVQRTRETAGQLTASRERERALRGENAKVKAEREGEQAMITELNTAIERQTATIAGLQVRVDSLAGENVRLGGELASVAAAHHRAYYVIGGERELLARGVVVREGGANLLVKRVGRTLMPSRTLDRAAFTEVDQRQLSEITVPDSSKQYRIVSRQSLDAAEVAARDAGDRTRFRGNLRIADADKFWGGSRYLIIVQEN